MHSITNQVVEYAFNICCKLYKINKQTLITSKTRDNKIIKAKRLLIYFFYNELEIRHSWMKKYFKDLHHATSIYHVNRFQYEVNNFTDIKKDYELFISEMCRHSVYGIGFYEKRKEIKKLLKEINKITND